MIKQLFICALTALTVSAARAQLVWYDGRQPVTYQVVGRVDPVVTMALQMFTDDMELVTGRKAVALTLGKGAKAAAGQGLIRIVQGKGSDDGFRLSVTPTGQILVEGHNARGTAYGLLELSRLAGVSPWVWWGDVKPAHRSRLTIAQDFVMEHTPSVEYRGIFINDEDWSLREWAQHTFERQPIEPVAEGMHPIKGCLGPKTYKEVFKLLLRLRANTIWPAMHEGTTGFFTVKGNKEMADSCGILIGTSHCEPLLRNNVAEWNVKQRGPYNYMTNREAVKTYWAERLKQVKGSEELFTIGMRGIHDGSMEGVKTPEEKLHGLQAVIDDQRELLRKYYRKDVEHVPQVFIPYKEVLEIYESGLRVPDDVMLMWCDDNYGYLTRLPDAEQQQRKGGGGVYYHLSYWGRPHDHLWLTTTQPGLIYSEMRTAYDHNCRRLWIANVHDPKVAAYDLELFLDMAWDIESITYSRPTQSSSPSRPTPSRPTPDPSLRGRGEVTLEEHLERWLCCQFGDVVGHGIAPAMRELYRLNAIRKPEFMGWTQVELDKRKFPGGKSVPATTEFTQTEACRRLADFGAIEATVDAYARMVPDYLQDAYFAAVQYPVHAAAAMSRKMLSEPVESRRAYEEILSLTERYNQLSGGKWRGLMSAAPRGLPVFDQVRTELATDTVADHSYIARNACDYASSTPSSQGEAGVKTIQMLGHSMNAVVLPKGSELVYQFTTPSSLSGQAEARLYTAMIPTQPSDRGDLRYSVQIDNQPAVVISLKEKYRSEFWKLSVLRGQALKQTPVRLSPGQHTLRIKALDDHIIADQWMIDFTPARRFYVLPVE